MRIFKRAVSQAVVARNVSVTRLLIQGDTVPIPADIPKEAPVAREAPILARDAAVEKLSAPDKQALEGLRDPTF